MCSIIQRADQRRSGLDRVHAIERKAWGDPKPSAQRYSHLHSRARTRADIDRDICVDTQRLAAEVKRLSRQVRVLKRAAFKGLFDSRQGMAEFMADVW